MAFKDPKKKLAYHQGWFREKYKDPTFRRAHIARVRARNQVMKQKLRELLLEFKSSGCLLCPEREVCCLSAHHRQPWRKAFNLSDAVNHALVGVDTFKKELLKCACLCHNCHAKVHGKVLRLPKRGSNPTGRATRARSSMAELLP